LAEGVIKYLIFRTVEAVIWWHRVLSSRSRCRVLRH
jgi:hypothetical protein